MHRLETVIAGIAFVVALFVAAGVYMLIDKPVTSENLALNCPPVPEYKDVVVAKKDIPLGEGIIDAVTTEKWPVNAVRESFFEKEAFKEEKFKGYIAQRPIVAGEPITKAAIVDTQDHGKLAAIVKAGYRAVSINVDQATAGGGLIMPGDIVDVIVTFAPKGAEETISKTALCAVRVLALDQRMSQGFGAAVLNVSKDTIPRTVTLEVDKSQAEVLSSAVKVGTASLSLISVKEKKARRCKEELFSKQKDTAVKIVRGDPVPEAAQQNSSTMGTKP